MQRRLAVVDAAPGVNADKDILVKAFGVVGGCETKKAAGADPPWRRPGEILTRNGGEGCFDCGSRDAGETHDLGCISLPTFGNPIRHAIPPAVASDRQYAGFNACALIFDSFRPNMALKPDVDLEARFNDWRPSR